MTDQSPELGPARDRTLSLKARLGVAAAALGLTAVLAAFLAVLGMGQVSDRIETALAAEARMDRYAVLSNQVARYLVVATESIQSGVSPDLRVSRLEGLTADITTTFQDLRRDLEHSVAAVADLGLDAQSSRATTSLAIARMEAHFNATQSALGDVSAQSERLQGVIDSFALGFDPHLGGAISDELRLRDQALTGIEGLRQRLSRWALVLGAVGLVLVPVAFFGLIRPLFRRLDRLRAAAQQVARQDFAIRLPEGRRDEIGQLFAETNRMAQALDHREAEVAAEWAGLNSTIADRTEDLRQANAALARRDADRRRFFADVSHELRTPLTVILMEAQLGEAAQDPESRAAFSTIRGRAHRLSRRIDDLLRLARSETGTLELAQAPFDLSVAVAEAIAEVGSEAEAAGVTLTMPPSPSVTCDGDAEWTRQILAELLRNAVRHGGARTHVAVHVASDGPHGRVQITDDGPGLPPELSSEQAADLFDRFRQGRAQSGGFGLGLALVKWVIEEQGGTIDLRSPPPDAPTGLQVTLALPRATG